MDFRPSGDRCKQEPACPFCGGAGCRDASRIVKSLVGLDEAGKPLRVTEIRRPRWLCLVCGRSWTPYEAGAYPHRTFTLAVEAAAVAELATALGATLASVARAFNCDRRSMGRWARQVAEIANADDQSLDIAAFRHCLIAAALEAEVVGVASPPRESAEFPAGTRPVRRSG